jgi:hypothetical protein
MFDADNVANAFAWQAQAAPTPGNPRSARPKTFTEADARFCSWYIDER